MREWARAVPVEPQAGPHPQHARRDLREEDGKPVALGYHTGHWEVGLLMRAAAEQLDHLERLPFAAFVSDPCDGRTQGTVGMMDSLAYRNDAATVFKRLIRSLPQRRAIIGVATCDKGLPAMMVALASQHKLPCIIVPGGVTLPPKVGEDAGKVQSIGARYAHGEITLDEAAEAGCHACAVPRRGCQFLGTAGTAQVVAEALGMTLPHAALAPSGQPIWLDMARRSASAVVELEEAGVKMSDILTEKALHNAMVVHAACGGSTNLLLHLPAIAFAAGLRRPTVDDWSRINRQVPRLVDVLPNTAPRGIPRPVQLFSGRRRSARGHVASAPPGAAADSRRLDCDRPSARVTSRLVGAVRTASRGCGNCSGTAIASIRTTSLCLRKSGPMRADLPALSPFRSAISLPKAP